MYKKALSVSPTFYNEFDDIQNHIAASLNTNSIRLYLQPKINMRTHAVTGAEALLRIPSCNGAYIQPSQVIQVAETSGQIVEIGEVVMRETCRKIRAALDNEFVLPVSVNVSAIQFNGETFVSMVKDALAHHRLNDHTHLLEVEVTESAMINDTNTVHILETLSGMGINLAIDDFGVGFSSLSHLKKMPVNNIKIDKSFVDHIEKDGRDRGIIQAVIAIARQFDIGVVAEGVETRSQAVWLLDNGCEVAQGFLFGHPVPYEEFVEIYKSGIPRRSGNTGEEIN